MADRRISGEKPGSETHTVGAEAGLSDLYGDRLTELVLFGSQARGDAEEGSDIDILVVLKGEVKPCDELDRVGDAVHHISFRNDIVVSCVSVPEEK